MKIPCAFDIGVWSSKIRQTCRQTAAERLAGMRLKNGSCRETRAGAHCVPAGTPAGRLPRRVPAAKPPERAPPGCVYEPALDAATPVYAAALFTNGLYRSKSFMFTETVSAAGAATLPADLSAPRKWCPSAAAPADTPEWPGSPAAAAPPRSAPDYGILRPKH